MNTEFGSLYGAVCNPSYGGPSVGAGLWYHLSKRAVGGFLFELLIES